LSYIDTALKKVNEQLDDQILKNRGSGIKHLFFKNKQCLAPTWKNRVERGTMVRLLFKGSGEMRILWIFILFFLGGLYLAGCSTSHEVQMAPVEVKPIHITIDVNVKVDRALDSFFDDIDKAEEQIK